MNPQKNRLHPIAFYATLLSRPHLTCAEEVACLEVEFIEGQLEHLTPGALFTVCDIRRAGLALRRNKTPGADDLVRDIIQHIDDMGWHWTATLNKRGVDSQ